jgi:hypothetical protein
VRNRSFDIRFQMLEMPTERMRGLFRRVPRFAVYILPYSEMDLIHKGGFSGAKLHKACFCA